MHGTSKCIVESCKRVKTLSNLCEEHLEEYKEWCETERRHSDIATFRNYVRMMEVQRSKGYHHERVGLTRCPIDWCDAHLFKEDLCEKHYNGWKSTYSGKSRSQFIVMVNNLARV